MALRQIVPERHDAVGVVDVSVVGQLVARRAPVLGGVNFLRLPERMHELRDPVQRLGPNMCQDENIFGCDGLNGTSR